MKSAQDIIITDIEEIIKELGSDINKLSASTLLITGSNGLLGSYLVDTVKYLNDSKLLDIPCKVIGLNRSKIKKGHRNFYLLKDKNFQFISQDISLPFNFPDNIDYIFHAAGSSTPSIFQTHPLETIDANVEGIRRILDYVSNKNSRVKSVVYFSSGQIYGNPPAEFLPTSETYNGNSSTLDTRACYIQSKRLAETLCRVYFDKHAVPVKIVRPFVIYGPGVTVNDGKVLSDFMKYGLKGEPIQMLTEGLDLRSDCYILDATVAFWKVLLSDFNGEVFNVGNEKQEFTIKRLAEVIHKLCNISSEPVYKGKPIPSYLRTAPKRFCPDMSKFKKFFGYEPKVGVEEGVKRTLNWNKLMLPT